MSTHCPNHGDNCRTHPRFAELETLIRLGYGDTSFEEIERTRAENGGYLPQITPEPEKRKSPFIFPRDEKNNPYVPEDMLATYQRMKAEKRTMPQIADELGISASTASRIPRIARYQGRRRLCDTPQRRMATA